MSSSGTKIIVKNDSLVRTHVLLEPYAESVILAGSEHARIVVDGQLLSEGEGSSIIIRLGRTETGENVLEIWTPSEANFIAADAK